MKKCCICGKDLIGRPNNPWPVDIIKSHACCDDCNRKKVIPARIKLLNKKEEN